MKKIIILVSGLTLLVGFVTSSFARDWLDLNVVQNKTDSDITVFVSDGTSISHVYDIKKGATTTVDDYNLDTPNNNNKAVMVNFDPKSKVHFSTIWHSGIAPNYTIKNDNGYVSPSIGVYIFQSIAYAKLIIAKNAEGRYVYTWGLLVSSI